VLESIFNTHRNDLLSHWNQVLWHFPHFALMNEMVGQEILRHHPELADTLSKSDQPIGEGRTIFRIENIREKPLKSYL